MEKLLNLLCLAIPLRIFKWEHGVLVQKYMNIDNKDLEMGKFWMSFQDFNSNFEVVTVNKIFLNYKHSYLKFKDNQGFGISKMLVLNEKNSLLYFHSSTT